MFKAQVVKIKKGVEGTEETIDLPKLFSLTGPIQESALKIAENQMKNLNKALDKVMNKREYIEPSNLTRQKILNNIIMPSNLSFHAQGSLAHQHKP